MIAEDEFPAIEHLTRLVESDKRLKLVCVVKSVKDARNALKRYDLDLVFLDINLRRSSGFDLIKDFPGICAVITTANAEFASTAFDANAIDFLHKPFSQSRFAQSVEKVIAARQQSRHQLFLRAGASNGKAVINLSEVIYLQARGKATCVVCEGRQYEISQLLGEIEKKLPTHDFVRIHRQYIVQKKNISRIYPSGRQWKIALRDHEDELPVGKTFAPGIKAMLK